MSFEQIAGLAFVIAVAFLFWQRRRRRVTHGGRVYTRTFSGGYVDDIGVRVADSVLIGTLDVLCSTSGSHGGSGGDGGSGGCDGGGDGGGGGNGGGK